MAGLTAWIADCHLQDRQTPEGETSQDYTCHAAVWAESYGSFRAQLIAYLATTPYKLLWVEECHEALDYIRRHGQQHKIGGLAHAVHMGHLVELGPLAAKGSTEEDLPAETLSFKDALRALDTQAAPVFAVLDGAQFDNLPKALFDGDFISRPLYLDRGENDPEQIITAPHMVTLDERSEEVTGRPYEETVEKLLTLIDNKPAAIFWQCPKGAETLYKHLRSINMVMIPKSALPIDEQEFIEGDQASALFRHADANVLAQTLFSMNAMEAARFYGPARRLIFAPDDIWKRATDYNVVDWSDSWPLPKPGILTLSETTMNRLETAREIGVKKWSVMHFTDPEKEGFDISYKDQVLRAYQRADEYGLEQKDDIWEFIRLDLKHGENFEHQRAFEAVRETLIDSIMTPEARIARASLQCRTIFKE